MALTKVLLVELKEDPNSEGVVVDRLAYFPPENPSSPVVLLGVSWLTPPHDKSEKEVCAIEYHTPDELTTIDVLDNMSELIDEEGEEVDEEEEEHA